jgi:hypothetical protein
MWSALNVKARDGFLEKGQVSKDLVNSIMQERFSLFKRLRIELVIIVSYPIIFL